MLPSEYLRILLAAARSLGIPFDIAWPQAVSRAAEIAKDKRGWLDALSSCAEAFRRAYEGLPATDPEVALASLTAGHLSPRDPLDGRRCLECGDWIPADVDARARFCGGRCRRAYNYRIERGETPRKRELSGSRALAAEWRIDRDGQWRRKDAAAPARG